MSRDDPQGWQPGPQHTLRLVLPDAEITVKRDAVRFNIRDCYRMAFAIGAGFTFGVAAAVGLVALAHAILAEIFS